MFKILVMTVAELTSQILRDEEHEKAPGEDNVMGVLHTVVTIGYQQLVPLFVAPMHGGNSNVGIHVILDLSGTTKPSGEHPMA